jgi:hypothetical protein
VTNWDGYAVKYWVLKGRPDENDWNEMLQPGVTEEWHTAKPPARWQVSDRLFCWESSPKLRVVGLAEVTNPRVRVNEAGETLFLVRYLTGILAAKPTITELRQIPFLNEASFLKSGPAATVLSISTERAELLIRVIYGKNPELPVVWPDVDHNTFGALIRELDLDFFSREGQLKLVRHLIRERNRAVIEAKKQAALRATGRLVCEVCTFNFEDVYGSRGHDFCEVHHLLPLSDVDGETETRLEDLAILCSNCHRMIHRQPWIQIEELKSLFT